MDRLKRAKNKSRELSILRNARRIKSPDGKHCESREKRIAERTRRRIEKIKQIEQKKSNKVGAS